MKSPYRKIAIAALSGAAFTPSLSLAQTSNVATGSTSTVPRRRSVHIGSTTPNSGVLTRIFTSPMTATGSM